jgi:hypothetical protein
MEQVEGGDLVVNRGNELRHKEGSTDRDLNALQSYDDAIKLAEVVLFWSVSGGKLMNT